MKRATTTASGAAFLLLLVFAGDARADTATYCTGAANKVDRGFCNLLGAPLLEIPYQVYSTAKERGVLAGTGLGLGKGTVMMPLRVLSGVYDLLTFPVPFPRDFGSLIKPDYIPWVEHSSTARPGGGI